MRNHSRCRNRYEEILRRDVIDLFVFVTILAQCTVPVKGFITGEIIGIHHPKSHELPQKASYTNWVRRITYQMSGSVSLEGRVIIVFFFIVVSVDSNVLIGLCAKTSKIGIIKSRNKFILFNYYTIFYIFIFPFVYAFHSDNLMEVSGAVDPKGARNNRC